MNSSQMFAGVLALALVSGCGDTPGHQRFAGMAPSAPTAKVAAKEGDSRRFAMSEGGQAERAPAEFAAEPQQLGGNAEPPKALPPKIIRTGDMQLIVDNFDVAFAKFKQVVDGIKGAYIAKAEISGSSGMPRSGVWKVRVPASSFDSFLDQLAGLGVPDRNVIDSRDVTEEYYDLDARLRNKKTEEARLVKHLESSTGKLDEILKVEHEISRVRGEIEQMEGRLRMIDNLATLTTVSVTIREIKNYVPAQAPTFTTRIQRTFGDSTDALVRFGEMVVLLLVGLAPWLPVLAIVVMCIYFGVRLSRRRGAAQGILSVEQVAEPPVG